MQIALFQPDIPQNLGAIIRFCACMAIELHIIEPCGFPLGDRKIKRAAMDYLDYVKITRHSSWENFIKFTTNLENSRIILATTKSSENYHQFKFHHNDILLFGRESAGVPDEVHKKANAAVKIEMQPHCRSLNLAMSVAMIAGEAMRQISLK